MWSERYPEGFCLNSSNNSSSHSDEWDLSFGLKVNTILPSTFLTSSPSTLALSLHPLAMLVSQQVLECANQPPVSGLCISCSPSWHSDSPDTPIACSLTSCKFPLECYSAREASWPLYKAANLPWSMVLISTSFHCWCWPWSPGWPTG